MSKKPPTKKLHKKKRASQLLPKYNPTTPASLHRTAHSLPPSIPPSIPIYKAVMYWPGIPVRTLRTALYVGPWVVIDSNGKIIASRVTQTR